MSDMSEWFTISEMADILKTTPKSIRAAAKNGSIESIWLGPQTIRVRLHVTSSSPDPEPVPMVGSAPAKGERITLRIEPGLRVRIKKVHGLLSAHALPGHRPITFSDAARHCLEEGLSKLELEDSFFSLTSQRILNTPEEML